MKMYLLARSKQGQGLSFGRQSTNWKNKRSNKKVDNKITKMLLGQECQFTQYF